MDISDYLQRRGGVARTSQLERAGFGRAAVNKAVAEGNIVRSSRGVYGIPSGVNPLLQAVKHGGLLTCLSAAPAYTLWTLKDAAALHICRSHPVQTSGLFEHGRPKHPKHAWLPVAGLADVLLHGLRCLPELESLVMVQSAVGRGDISLEFLYSRSTGRRNGKTRKILDMVIPRADSVLEVLANSHFARAGLRVRRHVLIPGVGEVDFLIEECLVVETDGSTHFEPRSVKKDQRRNNKSILGGYLVLRYYYEDVVYSPDDMVAEVLAVLELRRCGVFPRGEEWERTQMRNF
ncbi:type IV toxin-antitoxin system AbiEi family antitoxin domain-containing protein [Pseudarthrobacter sp. NS4]|uniref:type IV toxin-antitoxin system AbiEi family antitoxin domain-containing protein n=1 Tax=Pseudarthrobacter sp. NS4 TaxID=2973976 RepID=UPI002163EC73|nr:type IV toxin-antitoxin system AbiEi family antitoxin domain-containing protein [Pseudarthrobacter sp. NS4]